MTHWGKQTELAKKHFDIGIEIWPLEMINAQTLVKKAAARTNLALGILDKKISRAIERAADEILEGKHSDQFPLSIWQTGSGTQFNMNVNEVLASRASEILEEGNASHTQACPARGNTSTKGILLPVRERTQTGRILKASNSEQAQELPGEESLHQRVALSVHPNDHVNMSQSTNDTVPTAIHIAGLTMILKSLSPNLRTLIKAFEKKSKEFRQVIKIGRTHLQDAVPMTLGQEFSGYTRQLEYALEHLIETSRGLSELPIGATALGTQLNAPRGYQVRVIREINILTKLNFRPAKNLFANMAAHDGVIATSGALKTVAIALMKIANDIRWLGSGPRAGLGELVLPANEPGSSIMPGKVNPTQSEMLMMVCAQVIGNDAAITTSAATMSVLDMQASKPLLAYALLQSIRLLSDGARSFEEHCVRGIQADKKRLREYADQSLMLVTALNKHIGYDKAAEISKKAYKENKTLEEVAIESGYVTKEQFKKWVDVTKMI